MYNKVSIIFEKQINNKMSENNKLICRSCLSNDNQLINLFSVYKIDENLKYSTCFTLCTNIELVDDLSFPVNICKICTEKLIIAYQFRKQCEESNLFLKSHQIDWQKAVDSQSINPAIYDDTTQETCLTERQCLNIDQSEIINRNVDSEIEENVLILDKEESQSYIIQEKMSKEQSVTMTKKLYKCESCKNEYKSKNSLNRHISVIHKGLLLHRCNICDKSFAQKISLEGHLRRHRNEKPYKCQLCPNSFFTKRGLFVHTSVHEAPNKEISSSFLCATCGKNFRTNYNLKIHISRVHNGERNYSCDLCQKKFSDQNTLIHHRRIHSGEKPYCCKICGMSFIKRNALTCHNRVHSGERPYVCKICGIAFSQRSSLNGHSRIHTGERPFECDVCGKLFAQKNALNVHMTLHTGKTVKCPDCDKLFSKPSNLILHRRKHTGEKPYACDKCPSRYTQKCHLDRHLASHLGIKFKCDICTKEFTRKYKFKNHLKLQHGKIVDEEKTIRKSHNYLTTLKAKSQTTE